MRDSPLYDCAIIGAGISGLLAATSLKKSGYSVIVIDKGRGVGGRMATRRIGEACIDHGSQFFTQRSKTLAPWIKTWQENGLIQEWYANELDTVWRGSNGMTDVPKFLSQDLIIEKSTRVIELIREKSKWFLRSEDGRHFSSKTVILTAPLPQSVGLLDHQSIALPSGDFERLSSVKYTRCLAALVHLQSPTKLDPPGIIKIQESNIETITDNLIKGISKSPVLTIHSSAEFADKYWNYDDEFRLPQLIDSARKIIDFKTVEASMHRWGFAKTLNPLSESHYASTTLGLAIAGDGFIAGRVEAAAQSGLAAAESATMMLSD
ncbi:MAG: FAD-dependent oxidoreductase [Verrucomicrobiota bacterium]